MWPGITSDAAPASDPNQAQLHDVLQQEGCELVICERANFGMGASLACGVRAAANANAWIVALGDVPAIDTADVETNAPIS